MYKILVDSCGDFPEELRNDSHFTRVPLTLSLDGWEKKDDDSFDQADFLRRVARSKNVPKSACPSPGDYIAEIEKAEAKRVYIVTLSAQLSGSYNSALLAKNLYEEEAGEDAKQVYVFDSKSASIGQTLIAMKVDELEKKGLSFEEIVKQTEKYISGQHTFFVLESLETLRKAGRLGSLKARIASTLNIKPVMGSTDEGSICQLASARGMSRALDRMVECMISVTENTAEKILAISHCNAPQTAQLLVEKIKKAGTAFKGLFVVDTAGVSSLYAGDGGLIMVV